MITNSILDYPERGPWGNNKYRGNCTGYLIKDLLEKYQPKQFVEAFSGGGTGKDVAQSLGITNSIHLDLLTGWDALKDDMPVPADFVFSHPPYWDIIQYADMRGKADPDDLSNPANYEDFIRKLDRVNEKIYASLVNGGRHAFLMGDVRKRVSNAYQYYSIIKDMAWFGDLENHLIKLQHNVTSSRRQYRGNFIPIMHEHLLIFVKREIWQLGIKYTRTYPADLRQPKQITWRELVRAAVEAKGGQVSLQDLYAALAGAKKAANNTHWREQIRAVVQRYPEFKRVQTGVYAVA